MLIQPSTYEERVTQASEMAKQLGITVPILIDEMDNPVWCTYGPAPNIAYLIGTDGIIREKLGWYDPEDMKSAIQRYLFGKEPESGSLSVIEREMDVLIAGGNPVGDDHYQVLENKLETLKDTMTIQDKERLEDKLAILRDYSSGTKSGSSQEGDIRKTATPPPERYEPAKPDPDFDNFTWTLPTGASMLRLSLPADIEDFLFNEHGGIGGYGLHAGGHIEGLDHVWIELKPGTPVKSWADGVVQDVRYNGQPGEGEYHITIDYGYNLLGIHMEVMKPYVEKGDQVLRGQEVGMGMSFDPEQSSAEMSLVDMGRSDGVKAWGGGVYVSPFDYLEESDKEALVETYKEQVIEPYMKNQEQIWGFDPYQPYLTNNLFLHDENEGRLTGAWYLVSSGWASGYPNDLLTFIEADNPYYKGNIVLAMDDEDTSYGNWYIKGTFEVDYTKGQVIIRDNHGTTHYGIFEIDESSDRATLKIEYQQGSFPKGFSDEAITYIERSGLSRRADAMKLEVLNS